MNKLFRELKWISLGIPLEKYRYFFDKKRYKDFLLSAETFTQEQTEMWLLKHVQEIVDYAFEHVPYYKNVYSEIGYEKGSIRTFSDFEKLPFVTKDEIKQNLSLFVSDEVGSLGGGLCHTGGSTDKPMEFYLDRDTVVREKAFFEYYWNKNGYKFGERCVVVRGQHANPEQGKFTRFDPSNNYLLCDSRYLSNKDALLQIDNKIRKFGARIMQAYPSSAYSLARGYCALGIQAPHFDYVFLGSENTYDEQIEFIREVFSSKDVLYHYGHSECAAIAIKYQGRKELGFCPYYGYTELVSVDQSQDTSLNEIVATGFNRATPFIRYRTGDYAKLSNYKSNDFMSSYLAVSRIEGRRHEFIITSDNRNVSLCSVAGAHMPSLSRVGDMQYEQFEVGKLLISVTSPMDTPLDDDVLKGIKQDFIGFFGDSLNIEVRIVEKIEKTAAGKKVLLKQHLPI